MTFAQEIFHGIKVLLIHRDIFLELSPVFPYQPDCTYLGECPFGERKRKGNDREIGR